MKTSEVGRKNGISSATLYTSQATYDGLDVSQARKLKVLEQGDGRLEHLLIDAMLDKRRTEGGGGKSWGSLPLGGRL